jgi:TetR/AcrR family transcriptional regulator, transcriptional repressor for nem operon
MPRKPYKAARLIEAATLLIQQRGFDQTSLKDIAEKANVPLGNVYYYFKSKESIGEAVIKKMLEEQNSWLDTLNKYTDPLERLLAVLEREPEYLTQIVLYGCPIGTLCQELGKPGGSLANQVAKLLRDFLGWCESQFKALGLGSKATHLALDFVSHLQGIYILVSTFKDSKIFENQTLALQQWLRSLVSKAPIQTKKVVEHA